MPVKAVWSVHTLHPQASRLCREALLLWEEEKPLKGICRSSHGGRTANALLVIGGRELIESHVRMNYSGLRRFYIILNPKLQRRKLLAAAVAGVKRSTFDRLLQI